MARKSSLDYNAQGQIIGIEAIGSLARSGAQAMLASFLQADSLAVPDAVRQSLAPLITTPKKGSLKKARKARAA
jgi:hypothetical protein